MCRGEGGRCVGVGVVCVGRCVRVRVVGVGVKSGCSVTSFTWVYVTKWPDLLLLVTCMQEKSRRSLEHDRFFYTQIYIHEGPIEVV